MMSRLRVFLVILFFAMLAPKIYRIIQFMDFGEDIIPHTPGKCNKVKGIDKDGSEDIDIIPGTDIVVISNGMIWGPQTLFPGRKGRILFYDLSQKDGEAKPAQFKNYKDADSLNPHGISVWKDNKGGKVLLFVVNHRNRWADVDLVERFEVDAKTYTLTHLESITDPGFKVVNDVTAIGEKEFYFTNFMQNKPGSMMSKIETYLQLKNGEVCHYGPKGVTVVDGGLYLPDGINQSPDKRYLYVAHMGEHEIRTYDLQAENGPQLAQRMPVPTIVANIGVDPVTGDLWLGCQPIGWKMILYIEYQETEIAPSQVVKVSTKDGLLTEDLVEVYVDNGNTISASTIAVYHKGQLVIGSLGHNAVHCNV